MKTIFILFFYLNLIYGSESYCNNKKDYEMYLFTFNEHEIKLQKLKKTVLKNKGEILNETIMSNYYGLLYSECFAKVKEKEFKNLISSKI